MPHEVIPILTSITIAECLVFELHINGITQYVVVCALESISIKFPCVLEKNVYSVAR